MSCRYQCKSLTCSHQCKSLTLDGQRSLTRTGKRKVFGRSWHAAGGSIRSGHRDRSQRGYGAGDGLAALAANQHLEGSLRPSHFPRARGSAVVQLQREFEVYVDCLPTDDSLIALRGIPTDTRTPLTIGRLKAFV